MDPMILSVMYVWCQLNRDVIVQFWFGTQFKAIYFRIIKRQTIEKYYFALDVQNNYLNRNYK